ELSYPYRPRKNTLTCPDNDWWDLQSGIDQFVFMAIEDLTVIFSRHREHISEHGDGWVDARDWREKNHATSFPILP
ncbi:hypothetical protein HAX54_012469, partial [Datura stramonium]|nr:hypothetical protein [Datura stramonium]